MKIKILIVFIYIFAIEFTYSQTDTIKADISRFFSTGKDYLTAPLHFGEEDWIKFGGTVALSALAFSYDYEARDFSQRNLNKFNDYLFSADNYFYIPIIAFTLGIYGYGLSEDDRKLRLIGLEITEAIAYASFISMLSKFFIGRHRPYQDMGKFSFDSPRFEDTSLPSQHTLMSFAFVSVVTEYIDNIFLDIALYAAASAIGIARIYHNVHWTSDVFVGAALGQFAGDFVTNHPSNSKSKSNLSFYFGINRIGINYSF